MSMNDTRPPLRLLQPSSAFSASLKPIKHLNMVQPMTKRLGFLELTKGLK